MLVFHKFLHHILKNMINYAQYSRKQQNAYDSIYIKQILVVIIMNNFNYLYPLSF